METAFKFTSSVCAAAALFVCSPSFGADGSAYVGIGAGRSSISFYSPDFGSGPDSNATDSVTAGSHAGYKLYAGYRINDVWAVEAGRTHHGSFKYRSTDIQRVDSNFDYAARSAFVAGVMSANFPSGSAAFAKLGLAVNRARDTYKRDASRILLLPLAPGTVISKSMLNSRITPGTYSATSVAPLLGIGAEHALGPATKIRVEYEHYGRFGSAEMGRTSIGMPSLSLTQAF